MSIKLTIKNYSLAANVFLFSWLIALITTIIKITIEKNVPEFMLESLPYLIVNASVLYCGILAGKIFTSKDKRKKKLSFFKKNLRIKSSVFFLFILFFLISSIAFLYTSYGSIGSQRLTHIEATMDLEKGISSEGSGLIGYIRQYGQAFSLIIACIIPSALNLRLREKIFSSVILIVFNYCILRYYGGFQNLLVFTILPLVLSSIVIDRLNHKISLRSYGEKPVISIFEKQPNTNLSKPIKYSLYFLLICVMSFVSGYFFLNRSQGFSQYPDQFDKVLQMIAEQPQVRPYSEILNNMNIKGRINYQISFSISSLLRYFSNGIMHFGYFFQNYEYPPALGQHQLSFITSKIFDFEGFTFGELRRETFSIYRHFGVYAFVWGTYVRDYITDFGKLVTLLMSFASGALIGFLEFISYRRMSLYVLYIMSLVWLSFSPFVSYFLSQTFQISLFLVLFWVFIDFSFSPRKRSK